jgi:hypothetical protein
MYLKKENAIDVDGFRVSPSYLRFSGNHKQRKIHTDIILHWKIVREAEGEKEGEKGEWRQCMTVRKEKHRKENESVVRRGCLVK